MKMCESCELELKRDYSWFNGISYGTRMFRSPCKNLEILRDNNGITKRCIELFAIYLYQSIFAEDINDSQEFKKINEVSDASRNGDTPQSL